MIWAGSSECLFEWADRRWRRIFHDRFDYLYENCDNLFRMEETLTVTQDSVDDDGWFRCVQHIHAVLSLAVILWFFRVGGWPARFRLYSLRHNLITSFHILAKMIVLTFPKKMILVRKKYDWALVQFSNFPLEFIETPLTKSSLYLNFSACWLDITWRKIMYKLKGLGQPPRGGPFCLVMLLSFDTRILKTKLKFRLGPWPIRYNSRALTNMSTGNDTVEIGSRRGYSFWVNDLNFVSILSHLRFEILEKAVRADLVLIMRRVASNSVLPSVKTALPR